MSEHKKVLVCLPVSLKKDRRGMLDAVCFAHSVKFTWYEPHNDTVTFTLTNESYDLREFSRRISHFIEGPQDAVNTILRDLSMLE